MTATERQTYAGLSFLEGLFVALLLITIIWWVGSGPPLTFFFAAGVVHSARFVMRKGVQGRSRSIQ